MKFVYWFLEASGFIILFTAALKLGLATYLSKSIEFKLELQKDKDLVDYQLQKANKVRAELVSELLLEFYKKTPDTDKLNKLAFEAALWLPKEIVEDLTKLLARHNPAPDIKDILVKTRKFLLGEDEIIDKNSIVHFPDPSKNKL